MGLRTIIGWTLAGSGLGIGLVYWLWIYTSLL